MNKQKGLTLIELMITAIILAIIAGVGVPAMLDFFNRHSAANVVPLFDRTVKLARVEASQRSVNVFIKPTSNSDDWSQGWFIEDANDVIRRFDALPGSPVFTSDTFDGSTDITIDPTGQALTTGDFDLYYAGCKGNNKYKLSLLISGLVQKERVACN